MEIKKIEIVGLQALEAAFAFAQQVGAAQAFVFRLGADRVAGLGGEYGVVAAAVQGLADIRFGEAAGRAHRASIPLVHIGGVDEVDAQVESGVHYFDGFSFAHRRAEGHRAQAQGRDLEVGVQDQASLHAQLVPAQRTPWVISFCIPGRVKVSGPWPKAV